MKKFDFSKFSTDELMKRFEELTGKLSLMITTDVQGVIDEMEAIQFVLKERKDDGETK